ncbi:MAG: hypothetical protein AAGC92_03290 [Pseudomonadota bacterium]
MNDTIDQGDARRRAFEEIYRFHRALERWFHGDLPRSRLGPEILDALHPEFHVVFPSGTLVSCPTLCAELQRGHGSNPDLRIAIEEPHLLGVFPGLILASYVEYQRGARNSDTENGRRATVLFHCNPRLLWRHLHDTALP